MKDVNSKPHAIRKNAHAAEQFQKQRQERNARRSKQKWVGGESCKTGGHWERE